MNAVSGKILFDGWRGEPGPATVYVRLLDTTFIDAPARQVDEVVLHNVRLDEVQDTGIVFRLTPRELDHRARYEVGVLVDLDGDGKKSPGDYMNTRSYPVVTHGFSDQVEVYVCLIGRHLPDGFKENGRSAVSVKTH